MLLIILHSNNRPYFDLFCSVINKPKLAQNRGGNPFFLFIHYFRFISIIHPRVAPSCLTAIHLLRNFQNRMNSAPLMINKPLNTGNFGLINKFICHFWSRVTLLQKFWRPYRFFSIFCKSLNY